MKKILFIALAFGFTLLSQAQSTATNYVDDFKTWSISANLGFPYSNMDLWNFAPGRDRFDSPGGGLTLGGSGKITKYYNPFYGFYVAGTLGALNGTSGQRDNVVNGTQYRSLLLAGEGGVAINIFNAFNTNPNRTSTRHALIVSIGAGLAFYNPENYRFDVLTTTNRRWINSLFLSLDANYKYQLNKTWDLDLGVKAYFFETDGIDGVTFGQTKDRVIYFYAGATYNLSSKDRDKERSSIVYSTVFADMYNNTASVRRDMDKLVGDVDGDGVADMYDKDNETPAGVVVDGSGRALDVDMDGIPDYMDEDPFTGKGAKVDAKGRELDTDGDGVPDSRDQEVNTPKGALVDANGRQIKNVGGGGGVSDAVLPQVFFATNGTSISAANAERLATIARVLASNENLTLTVTGHTDKTGSEAYNRKLGERRAKAVIDYMVRNYGIDASRLEAVSAGEDSPLSAQLLNINRRVEFNIK